MGLFPLSKPVFPFKMAKKGHFTAENPSFWSKRERESNFDLFLAPFWGQKEAILRLKTPFWPKTVDFQGPCFSPKKALFKGENEQIPGQSQVLDPPDPPGPPQGLGGSKMVLYQPLCCRNFACSFCFFVRPLTAYLWSSGGSNQGGP